MTPRFEQIAVLGLGLLGGSVAWAARERGLAVRVVGATRSGETAAEAEARGIVDRADRDPSRAAAGSDLVVVATPVSAMAEVLRAAAPALREGALVTDVGSVKTVLVETLPGLLPPGVHYVGAHPMAGSHQRGLAHARRDLLEGAACVLTPDPGTPADAVERVAGFWAGLGARVLRRGAAVHDAEVAWISHLPHALAFAFARALAHAPAGAAEVRGAGFRDFTRIAWSEAELWADILVHNRKAVVGPLTAAADRVVELARLVEAGNAEGLERFIALSRENLARMARDARSGGGDPEIHAVAETAAIQETQRTR